MQQCQAIQQHDPFMVQQIPEIRNRILANKNWKEIAQFQKENYYNNSKDKREFDMLMELANVYGNDAVDTIIEGFHCPNCDKVAVHRCTRCKSEWYCSKACQVEHYKKEHKKVCKIWAAEYEARKNAKPKGDDADIKTKQEKVEEFIIKEASKNTKVEQAESLPPKTEVKKDVVVDLSVGSLNKENEQPKPVFNIEELD